VLVPKSEYDDLLARAGEHPKSNAIAPSPAAVAEAVRTLTDPAARWHDAEGVMRDLVLRGVGAVRKTRGFSQKRLGDLLGVAQSQVCRYERNPDAVTVRVLRKIARVLAGSPPESRAAARQMTGRRSRGTSVSSRRSRRA
jgi:hypothetical protein